MQPTLKNKEIIDLNKSMIDLSYGSREKDFVVGSFLSINDEIESTLAACSMQFFSKQKEKNRNPQHKKSDIWSFFHVTSIVSNTPRKDDADTGIVCKTITIDD